MELSLEPPRGMGAASCVLLTPYVNIWCVDGGRLNSAGSEVSHRCSLTVRGRTGAYFWGFFTTFRTRRRRPAGGPLGPKMAPPADGAGTGGTGTGGEGRGAVERGRGRGGARRSGGEGQGSRWCLRDGDGRRRSALGLLQPRVPPHRCRQRLGGRVALGPAVATGR